MIVRVSYGILRVSRLRITGTVTNPAGEGLARELILYNSNHAETARTRSNRDGAATFTVSGSAGDRWTVLAVGRDGECDAVSCPIRVAPE